MIKMDASEDDSLARQMYQEHILDLYKNPHNNGKLENATGQFRQFNPLCGDDITMQVYIKDGKIQDVKFFGSGCAISIAATSMITDAVKGKKVSDVLKMTKDDVMKLIKIKLSHVRVKCAIMPLDALQKSIKSAVN